MTKGSENGINVNSRLMVDLGEAQRILQKYAVASMLADPTARETSYGYG